MYCGKEIKPKILISVDKNCGDEKNSWNLEAFISIYRYLKNVHCTNIADL
jgi:hypothetical protein